MLRDTNICEVSLHAEATRDSNQKPRTLSMLLEIAHFVR